MKKIIKIEGMSCNHCVSHVKEALENIKDVNVLEVNLENKNALVETEVDNNILKNAIEEEGYDVISID
ncbi:heavy-metal-associated domain-containing protein [Clostridium nigeriense]|uniref:heavy-metal-associated domain-containing protein n=1 Tax=Clostridium nigeriense TaxID=1805470 RepID=UPI000830A0D7|nr:heavy metal-associated domain-containing protein [Clostridium nigeriense]